ncbi:MAG: hypothetical protein CME06_06095 [Gemmatimonadetes bacterium]|nr:hypothetical protein [Gemmatimonadota bacterium]
MGCKHGSCFFADPNETALIRYPLARPSGSIPVSDRSGPCLGDPLLMESREQDARARAQVGSVRREAALGLLLLIYLSVSIVVYTDYPREPENSPLSALEWEGLGVWRARNCQACHQLHGFGGFLGPDLTNRVSDDTPDDAYQWILFKGLGRMPALKLSDADQAAVLAFLRAMNRTGTSLPPRLGARRAVDSWEHSRLIAEMWVREESEALPAAVERGLDVLTRNRCGACHVPFTEGRHRAADLSAAALDRSIPSLWTLLREGRGLMPAFPMEDEDVEDLSGYLSWASEHRSELIELNDRLVGRENISWSAIPWFEYQ